MLSWHHAFSRKYRPVKGTHMCGVNALRTLRRLPLFDGNRDRAAGGREGLAWLVMIEVVYELD